MISRSPKSRRRVGAFLILRSFLPASGGLPCHHHCIILLLLIIITMVVQNTRVIVSCGVQLVQGQGTSLFPITRTTTVNGTSTQASSLFQLTGTCDMPMNKAMKRYSDPLMRRSLGSNSIIICLVICVKYYDQEKKDRILIRGYL